MEVINRQRDFGQRNLSSFTVLSIFNVKYHHPTLVQVVFKDFKTKKVCVLLKYYLTYLYLFAL